MCEDRIIFPKFDVSPEPIPINRDSEEYKDLIDRLYAEIYKSFFCGLGVKDEIIHNGDN